MSNEAITWAFSAPVAKSVDRLLLVCLANHENNGLSWPSYKRIHDLTMLDRKTIWAGLSRLNQAGHIVDTGERRGATKQVPVWRLVLCGRAPQTEPFEVQTIPQTELLEETITVPSVPHNGSVYPAEQFRLSSETVPYTELGTLKEPFKEPSREPLKTRARAEPRKREPGPVEEAAEIWNRICCPPHPSVQKLTDQRRKKFARVFHDDLGGDLDRWRQCCAEVIGSKFLSTATWMSFDWMMETRNMTKVLEGNYADRKASKPVSDRLAGLAYLDQIKNGGTFPAAPTDVPDYVTIDIPEGDYHDA